MKEFIYNEMMVHVGLCTNKDPKNVLIMSSKAEGLRAEVARHEGVECSVVKGEKMELRPLKDAQYDVIITEVTPDAAVLAHYNRILKEDGLIVTAISSLDNVDENKQIMEILAKYTKIIMPFDVGEGKIALLASKEYHPTADIILQRADMLDGLQYYNCDVHPASFAMGNYIRKEYLGVIRN